MSLCVSLEHIELTKHLHWTGQSFSCSEMWEKADSSSKSVTPSGWCFLTYLSDIFKSIFSDLSRNKLKKVMRMEKQACPPWQMPWCDFLGHGNNLTAKWKAAWEQDREVGNHAGKSPHVICMLLKHVLKISQEAFLAVEWWDHCRSEFQSAGDCCEQLLEGRQSRRAKG